VEHINHWMETAGSGLTHAGLLASLLPQNSSHFPSIDQDRPEDSAGIEPSRKRLKLPGVGGQVPENIKDEVARLTSEVATLKKHPGQQDEGRGGGRGGERGELSNPG